MTEIPDVTVKVSKELLARMGDWSEPVQIKIDHLGGGEYTMVARALEPAIRESRSTCALWHYRYRPDYDLEDSEAEAARLAVMLEDSDDPTLILGIQFADGRTIPADQWEALADARVQARQEKANRPLPTPIPTHTMRDPFRGEQVEVEDDSPSWVGR